MYHKSKHISSKKKNIYPQLQVFTNIKFIFKNFKNVTFFKMRYFQKKYILYQNFKNSMICEELKIEIKIE